MTRRLSDYQTMVFVHYYKDTVEISSVCYRIVEALESLIKYLIVKLCNGAPK